MSWHIYIYAFEYMCKCINIYFPVLFTEKDSRKIHHNLGTQIIFWNIISHLKKPGFQREMDNYRFEYGNERTNLEISKTNNIMPKHLGNKSVKFPWINWCFKKGTFAIYYLENWYIKGKTIKLYLYKLYHWVASQCLRGSMT